MPAKIKPPALKPGNTIGVMAPSSRIDREVVERGAALLESYGYNIHIHPQTYATDHSSAGFPAEKIRAFNDLISDNAINAIMFARGGNRGGLLLPALDYDLIKKHPKILIGFSDPTALLNTISSQTGLITFHGPMMNWLGFGHMRKEETEQCLAVLSGENLAVPLPDIRTVRTGDTKGLLAGGSLSTFITLIGTPFMPEMNGKILFLEDIGDEMSRYDRMFIHLKNAGIFDRIAGLILGDFDKPLDTGNTPFGFTLEEIIREHTDGYDFPVVMNAPFGHGEHLYTLPIGGPARLVADHNHATLELTESPVTV